MEVEHSFKNSQHACQSYVVNNNSYDHMLSSTSASIRQRSRSQLSNIVPDTPFLTVADRSETFQQYEDTGTTKKVSVCPKTW